jgi:hypothetical protein
LPFPTLANAVLVDKMAKKERLRARRECLVFIADPFGREPFDRRDRAVTHGKRLGAESVNAG